MCIGVVVMVVVVGIESCGGGGASGGCDCMSDCVVLMILLYRGKKK